MLTLLVILLVVVIFGGGWGYAGGYYTPAQPVGLGINVVGLALLIIIVLALTGQIRL